MKLTPILLGPLLANLWKSNYFSRKIASKKKPVGRPIKPYTLEKAYEDMNKFHDFWKMVDRYKSYDLQIESYCKSSPDADLGGPSNTRRRFTNQKKAEKCLH